MKLAPAHPITRKIPLSLKILTTVILAGYTMPLLLLTFFLPKAELNILEAINLKWILLWTTGQAVLASLAAVALGVPVGIGGAWYGSKIASSWKAAGLPIFMAPSVAVILGFRSLAEFGVIPEVAARAPLGIILVHAYYNIPLAAVLTYASISDRAGELADYVKSIGIKGMKLWVKILIPAAVPGAAAAFILAFVYSFTGLAAPLMVEASAYKYYTLEAWIYTIYWGFPSKRLAAVLLSLLQASLLLIIAVTVFRIFSDRPAVEVGSPSAANERTTTSILLDWYSAVLLAILYAPLVAVVAYSFVDPYTGLPSIQAYKRLIFGPLPVPPGASFLKSLGWSIIYALATSLLSLLVSLYVALGSTVRRLASMAPLTISPIVAGIAVHLTLYQLLKNIFGHIVAVAILLILVHSAMAIPLSSRALEVGLRRVPREALDLIVSLRLTSWKSAVLLLRAAWPGAVAAFLLAAASSLGEFGAAIVITEPSTWSLGILTYNLYSAGRVLHIACASAAVLELLSLLLMIIASRKMETWF